MSSRELSDHTPEWRGLKRELSKRFVYTHREGCKKSPRWRLTSRLDLCVASRLSVYGKSVGAGIMDTPWAYKIAVVAIEAKDMPDRDYYMNAYFGVDRRLLLDTREEVLLAVERLRECFTEVMP